MSVYFCRSQRLWIVRSPSGRRTTMGAVHPLRMRFARTEFMAHMMQMITHGRHAEKIEAVERSRHEITGAYAGTCQRLIQSSEAIHPRCCGNQVYQRGIGVWFVCV